MRYLPFIFLAQFLNSISVLIGKYLLIGSIQQPILYIFYISIFSLVAIFFLPFTKVPSLEVFFLASVSTLLWTTGAYFMLKSLQLGNASRVIPVIGVLIPLLLLVESVWGHTVTSREVLAIVFSVLGLAFLTVTEWRGKVGIREIVFEFISAVFFAASYVFLYTAYTKETFLTVLVWSRFVLIPVGIFIIVIPALRSKIFNRDKKKLNLFSKTGLLFLGGQCAGGISELLLTYSISLASPAIVNSLQGIQYIFLYLGGIFLSKKLPNIFSEQHSFWGQLSKLVGIIFIAAGLYMLAFLPHN